MAGEPGINYFLHCYWNQANGTDAIFLLWMELERAQKEQGSMVGWQGGNTGGWSCINSRPQATVNKEIPLSYGTERGHASHI